MQILVTQAQKKKKMNHGFKWEPAKAHIDKLAFSNDILVPKIYIKNIFFGQIHGCDG